MSKLILLILMQLIKSHALTISQENCGEPNEFKWHYKDKSSIDETDQWAVGFNGSFLSFDRTVLYNSEDEPQMFLNITFPNKPKDNCKLSVTISQATDISSCADRIKTGNTCSFECNNNNQLISIDIFFTKQLEKENDNFTVEVRFEKVKPKCILKSIIKEVKVEKCQDPTGFKVSSSSGRYNTSGIVSCSSSDYYLYSNASFVSNASAKCLANTKWKLPKDLKCLTTPRNVTLAGKTYLKENETTEFSCNYSDEKSDIPKVSELHFTVTSAKNGYNISKTVGATEKLTFNASKYHKDVICQAINIVTNKNQASGYAIKKLNVTYPPYFHKPEILCKWTEGVKERCEIEFFSNPPTSSLKFTKDGKTVDDTLKNVVTDGHLQIFTFIKQAVTSDQGNFTLTVANNQFVNISATTRVMIEVSSKKGLSGGAIAGIVIGVLMGICFLAILVIYVLRSRK